MRLRHSGGQLVHLSYGTNVHPADDLRGVIAQLDTYASAVRRRLHADVLALSLGVPANLAAALAANGRARRQLRAELDARGLEVVTLNGVSAASLRSPVAQDAGHEPDWTGQARLDHTLDLARVLVDLLPDDAVRGSVATLGLGRRASWSTEKAGLAARMLDRLSAGLAEIAWHTGRAVRVAFLPEPGGVLQSSQDVAASLSGVDTDRLGVCLDLGNLACGWEEPGAVLARLGAAGLPVVRVQLSTALDAPDPARAADALGQYVHGRFRHATCPAEGRGIDDLDEALRVGPPGPWRVRYPTPLHTSPEPPLTSTTDVLRDGVRRLFGGSTVLCDHVDVETYTWDVLPTGRRPGTAAELADGIAAELAFARDELRAAGLAPVSPATCAR